MLAILPERLDEFKCSPVHVERMRYVYNYIMAETYKSTWFLDTIGKLSGQQYEWEVPFQQYIYDLIMESDYAIG